MRLIKFKYLSILFLLFTTTVSFGQKTKMPELDVGKKTYSLDFKPDYKNKQILSAYIKGETETDSLKFLANGTIAIQKVMITVASTDKYAKITIDIVKGNWKNVKRSGKTINGYYEESFDTAGQFGIIIHSDKPNTPFYMAVWTSGEIIPNSTTIFYPASEYKTRTAKAKNINNSNNQDNSTKNSNSLLYIIIGVLAIIAILLLLLVLKKKSSKTLTLLIILIFSQTMFAGIIPSNPAEVMEVIVKIDGQRSHLDDFKKTIDDLKDGNLDYDFLDDSDSNSVPDIDDRAEPQLPSSCLNNTDSRIKEGCECLDGAYEELNTIRFKFEKLRIIYSNTKKMSNKAIAFGDNVSGGMGSISALAWQKEKRGIEKSLKGLDKAYDAKYTEFIERLYTNLKQIDTCEAKLNFSEWYSKVGFIYYDFMKDKYKRN